MRGGWAPGLGQTEAWGKRASWGSIEHSGLGQEEHHTSSNGGVRPPSHTAGPGVSPTPTGRSTQSRRAAWVAPSHPSAETHKGDMKLVCLDQGFPWAPQIPQNRTVVTLGARGRLPEGLMTGGGSLRARAGASRSSPSGPRLRSRRARPAPSPEPAGAGVEAGSRSFVFVSRKDSDYRSALRACSPGNLSAHYPALLQRDFLPRNVPVLRAKLGIWERESERAGLAPRSRRLWSAHGPQPVAPHLHL